MSSVQEIGVKAVQKSVQKDPERLDGKSKIIDPVSSSCQPSCEDDDGLQSTCFDETFESIDESTVTAYTPTPQEIHRIIFGTPERKQEASALPVYKRRDSLLQTRSDSPVPLHSKDAEEPLPAELSRKAAVKKTTTNKNKLIKKPIPKGVKRKFFPSSDEEPYSYHMDVEVTDPKKAKVDYIYDDLSDILTPPESPPRDLAVVTAGADRSRYSSPIIKTNYRKNYVSRDQSQLSTPKSDKALLVEPQSSISFGSQASLASTVIIDRGDRSNLLNAADYYVANNQADRESKLANETYLEDDAESEREEATEAVASQDQSQLSTPKSDKALLVEPQSSISFGSQASLASTVIIDRGDRSNLLNAADYYVANNQADREPKIANETYLEDDTEATAAVASQSAPPLRHRKPNDRKKINTKWCSHCCCCSHCCKNSVKNNPYGALGKFRHRLEFDRSKVAEYLQVHHDDIVDQIINGLTAQVSDSDDSVEGECDGSSVIVLSDSDSD